MYFCVRFICRYEAGTMPVLVNHSAFKEWQPDVWDERIHRLGVRKFPSGISLFTSDSTPVIPLLALDTIRPIFFPAISGPYLNRNDCGRQGGDRKDSARLDRGLHDLSLKGDALFQFRHNRQHQSEVELRLAVSFRQILQASHRNVSPRLPEKPEVTFSIDLRGFGLSKDF